MKMTALGQQTANWLEKFKMMSHTDESFELELVCITATATQSVNQN